MSIVEIAEIILNEENEPLVMADRKILCHVVNAIGERDTIGIEPSIVNSVINITNPETQASDNIINDDKDQKEDWSEEQTRYILDKYYEYLSQVGPLKKFRLKKEMWNQISKEINMQYKINKNGTQVENRYKTVMKRKKKAVDNNKTSGSKRMRVDYEEELTKISEIDDSIELEVLQDQNTFVKKDKITLSNEKNKHKENVISYLKTINEERKKQREAHHREKEENKDRRLREKFEFLKELLKNS